MDLGLPRNPAKNPQKTLNLFNDKALKLVCKFSVEIIIQCFVDIIQTSDENPKTQIRGKNPTFLLPNLTQPQKMASEPQPRLEFWLY